MFSSKTFHSFLDNKVLDVCSGKIVEGGDIILWEYHGGIN